MITEPNEFMQRLQELQDSSSVTYSTLPSNEPRFIIDANSRTIKIPPEFQFLGVKNDHKAETIYFEIDRYFDSEDLSTHACVVQFENKSGEGGIYPVTVMDTESVDGKIIFGWEILSDATTIVGDIIFSVRFYSLDNYVFTYNFNTLPAKSVILDTLNVDDPTILENYPSELEAWLDRMNDLSRNVVKPEDVQALDTKMDTLETSFGKLETNVNSSVDELKSDLSELDLVLNPILEEVSGYYYNDDNNANFSSNEQFCYTKPIKVKKGDKIVLTGAGFNTSVSMICMCDENNTSRIALVYSTNSNVNDYVYDVTMDCFLTFSYKNSSTHKLSIYRKEKNISVDGIFNSSPAEVGCIKKCILTDISLISHTNYCYTKPIKIGKNMKLKFIIACETNVSALSECDSEGNIISSLIAGKSATNKDYEYEATEDCYVIICFRTRYSEYPASAELVYLADDTINMSFSMFEKWGVVGDSFATGVFMDTNLGRLDNNTQKSWGQILARKSGNKCTNFSKGGLYCKTWLTDNDRGLPLLLSETAKELYIIALGINDVGHQTEQPVGTISDIKDDFTQNPNTFYGNYGKIIGNIKSHAPKAKIIMSTIPYNGNDAMIINDAIIDIANHFELPCLMVHTDKFFRSEYYWDNFEQEHPKSFVYGAMANAYERMICDNIKSNATYWGDTFNSGY